MLKGLLPKRGATELAEGELVAYFCAEFGITDKLPIYAGGLGILAGDIVQEAAHRKFPLVAIGLFYQKGYFHQFVDTEGQHEQAAEIDPASVPLQLAVDEDGQTVLIEVPIEDRIVFAQVWKYQVGSVSILLLDTNHWKNSSADRKITNQLYSGGPEKRILQELVLGIGGFRTLQRLELYPTIYHMNEGHSAFLALELIKTKLAQNNDFDQALTAARKHLVFTNHTLIKSGNDAFPVELVKTQLKQYAQESGIKIEKILELGQTDDQPGIFSMAILAMRMAYKSNAVSRLHTDEAKKVWPEFTLFPVTNGVFLPAWIDPEWQRVWKEYIPDWKTDMANQKLWRGLNRLPAEKVWQIHNKLKTKLLAEIYNREGVQLDSETLTVVWARRFAAYKRPDLLFNDIEKLKELVFSSDRPIQIIVAGKSHPSDKQGKDIIAQIEYLSNYDLKRRAIFIDDYSITLARLLTAGADVWLNTPIFGLEASGTSGMKSASNGVIQFTTPDGWAWEVDWYGLGYTLPIQKAETQIYKLFEKKIIPTYYQRDNQGIPRIWVEMMKETIMTVSPRFSATRMLNEYIKNIYLERPY